MSNTFLAVVNPAAGGGRCGELAGPALEKLRAAGIELQVVETGYPGQATDLAWEAYRNGARRFLAVGGDGTAYEIVNGLFPEAAGGSPDSGEPPLLGFLPLGTGNSFLRDFTDRAADYAIERGTGRKLGVKEAIDMLKRCEEDGLVHTTENKRADGTVICNCCSDCCINWPSIRTGLGKFAAPSRFRASLDVDECNGCALCVETCYFDAMSMDDDDDLVKIAEDNCMGCGLCEMICPTGALYRKMPAAGIKIPEEASKAMFKEFYLDPLAKAEAEGRFRRLAPVKMTT